MACCGGKSHPIRAAKAESKPRRITSQMVVTRPKKTKQVGIIRQYVIPRNRCEKCGYPTMVVNIGNRERYQCSNPNCKKIIK